MSSTFAVPATRLSNVRLPGRRRRHAAPSADVGIDETFSLQFLRTPASWTVVENRPVNYLDQVIVTPAGILAVTTRYHGPAEGDAHVQRAWSDIRTAKGAAKLLEISLDADGAEVRPVLLLWGPGAPELEKGYLLVKGVWVLDPRRPELWAHLFDAPADRSAGDRVAADRAPGDRAPAVDDVTHRRLLNQLRRLYMTSNDSPIALAE